MTLPLAEFYPDGLTPDVSLVEHAEPVPHVRRPLSPESAGRLARGLCDRAAVYERRAVQDTILGLGMVHARWSAPRSAWREEAVSLLHATTGYPETVLDRHLRKTFAGLRRPELDRWLIHSRRGYDPELDRTDLMKKWPGLTVVISSGNIPGAALPSVVQSLARRSPCLVKTAAAEPFLLPLYARSLRESDSHLWQGLAVTNWEGGDAALETEVLQEADAVVAYGGDSALRQVQSRTPLHARFVGYGHRISFSAIGRERLTAQAAKRLATGVALDAAVFDQQGCLSPQAVYLERGGELSPETFGELLAGQMARLERMIPRRRLSPAEASAIHQYRADVEMRAFGRPALRLWSSSGGTAWTVVLEEDPELRPCPLNRTVVLRPLDDLSRLPEHLPERGAVLLSAGLAVADATFDEMTTILRRCGVSRITRIGHAQRPIDSLYHDGVHALAALTRYDTVEY